MKTCHTTDGLVTLSDDKWDALCDGCGLCCRITHDRPGGDAMCPGYDCSERQCGIYEKRIGQHSCIQLEPDLILGLHGAGILPASCGYVSFMTSSPKLEPEEFVVRPFGSLSQMNQLLWKGRSAAYQADVEGSLSKFKSRPSS